MIMVNDEEGNSIFGWGRGDAGQLGIPQCQLKKDKMGLVQLKPVQIKTGSEKVIKFSIGDAHTLILT